MKSAFKLRGEDGLVSKDKDKGDKKDKKEKKDKKDKKDKDKKKDKESEDDREKKGKKEEKKEKSKDGDDKAKDESKKDDKDVKATVEDVVGGLATTQSISIADSAKSAATPKLYVSFYEQGNAKATRKVTAPLLQKVVEGFKRDADGEKAKGKDGEDGAAKL